MKKEKEILKAAILSGAIVAVLFLSINCFGLFKIFSVAIAETPESTPTSTPSEEATPTPSEEPTTTPTEEPTPTPSEEPVPPPTEEPAPTPTEEPGPTPTEEPTPTPIPTPTPTPPPFPTEEPVPPPKPCGNNEIEGVEECDGTDDEACPGQCIPPDETAECQCLVTQGDFDFDAWAKTQTYIRTRFDGTVAVEHYLRGELVDPATWPVAAAESSEKFASDLKAGIQNLITKPLAFIGQNLITKLLTFVGIGTEKKSNEPIAKIQLVDCSEHYSLGSINFKSSLITPNRPKAGDTISVRTNVLNGNDYPIADGMIFVKIHREKEVAKIMTDADYADYLIDEFVAVENINLRPKEEKEINFTWPIPGNVIGGRYNVSLYFAGSKQFNLAGLSFFPTAPGKVLLFDIAGMAKGFWIDNGNIQINNEKIIVPDWTPEIKKGEDVVISVPLKNTLGKGNAAVHSDLYFFDLLNKENKLPQYQQTKAVSLNSSGQLLEFKFSGLEVGAYIAKISVEGENQKSAVDVRFVVPGNKGRFVFSGLEPFPFDKGGQFALFSCFVNGGNFITSFNGKVETELKDKRTGKVFAKMSYAGIISPDRIGIKQEFIAPKDGFDLLLTSRLTDAQGNLMDEVKTEYNLGNFSGGVLPPEKTPIWKIISIIFGILVLSVILYLWKKRRGKGFKANTSLTIIIVIVSFFLFFAADTYALDWRAQFKCIGADQPGCQYLYDVWEGQIPSIDWVEFEVFQNLNSVFVSEPILEKLFSGSHLSESQTYPTNLSQGDKIVGENLSPEGIFVEPKGFMGSPNIAWVEDTGADGGNIYYSALNRKSNSYGNTDDGACPPGITLETPQAINVLSPNGGETWAPGNEYNIIWTSAGTLPITNVKIELYKGGIFIHNIAPNIANTGIYAWTVPFEQVYGSGYTIKVSNASKNTNVSDGSNSNFSISPGYHPVPAQPLTVLSPNGGETLEAGNRYNIIWTYTGIAPIAKVNIDLCKGGSCQTIIANTPNDGTQPWTIPTALITTLHAGTDYKIRISKYGETSLYDESNNNFSILWQWKGKALNKFLAWCNDAYKNPYGGVYGQQGLENSFNFPTYSLRYTLGFVPTIWETNHNFACIGTQIVCDRTETITIADDSKMICTLTNLNAGTSCSTDNLATPGTCNLKGVELTSECVPRQGATGGTNIQSKEDLNCFAYLDRGIFITATGGGGVAVKSQSCRGLYLPMRLTENETLGKAPTYGWDWLIRPNMGGGWGEKIVSPSGELIPWPGMELLTKTYYVDIVNSRVEVSAVDGGTLESPTAGPIVLRKSDFTSPETATYTFKYNDMFPGLEGAPHVANFNCGDKNGNKTIDDGDIGTFESGSCNTSDGNNEGTCTLQCQYTNPPLGDYNVYLKIYNDEKFAEANVPLQVRESNALPVVIDLDSEPKSCFETLARELFTWGISASGGKQTAFQLQADTSANFSSIDYDSGEILADVEPGGTYSFLGGGPEGIFEWNTKYYWRLKVKDINGQWSDWYQASSPSLPYFNSGNIWPWPEFEYQLEGEAAKHTCSNTDCNNASVAPDKSLTLWNKTQFCSSCTYYWNFNDGTPLFVGQNPPVHEYLLDGTYPLTLKVVDNTDALHYCELKLNVIVGEGAKPPKWREIPPFSMIDGLIAGAFDFLNF